MPVPAIAGEAIEAPLRPVGPQLVAALDDRVLQPGAEIAGWRRPSAVGPVPPVQWLAWFGVSEVAPTARRFLAFSGFLSVPRLVTARQTIDVSFSYWKMSKPRQRLS